MAAGSSVQPEYLPKHVAIIMDGNGRWAKKLGRDRLWGHTRGIEAVRMVVRESGNRNIQALTLFAFSEENWGRPKLEVQGIMSLIDTYVLRELPELLENNVQLKTIGDLDRLPAKTRKSVKTAVDKLKDNTGLVLTIALSYSGQADIASSCQAIAEAVERGELTAKDINSKIVEKFLPSGFLAPVDLLIRTSGELRISNFLLWQLAYTELYFTDVLWPDFGAADFEAALAAFANRQRRYGLVDPNQTWTLANAIRKVSSRVVAGSKSDWNKRDNTEKNRNGTNSRGRSASIATGNQASESLAAKPFSG